MASDGKNVLRRHVRCGPAARRRLGRYDPEARRRPDGSKNRRWREAVVRRTAAVRRQAGLQSRPIRRAYRNSGRCFRRLARRTCTGVFNRRRQKSSGILRHRSRSQNCKWSQSQRRRSRRPREPQSPHAEWSSSAPATRAQEEWVATSCWRSPLSRLLMRGAGWLPAAGCLPALLLTALTASAQWIHQPTAGIPRTPDGSLNLTAPAPKAPDGKPDISGLWVRIRPPGAPGGPEFGNTVTYYMAPGSKVPFQPWAEALFNKRRYQDLGANRPSEHCLPHGIIGVDAAEYALLQADLRALERDRAPLRGIHPLPPDLHRRAGRSPRIRIRLGTAIPRARDDDTFVVESAGFNDKILGSTTAAIPTIRKPCARSSASIALISVTWICKSPSTTRKRTLQPWHR